MRTYWRYVAFLALLGVTSFADEDRFGVIKNQLAEAPCVRFDFISVVESDIFDVIDSTHGMAILAADGRYRIEIGPDTYLNDGEFLFCYVPDNNQVTIEPHDGGSIDEEVSFLTRLDKIYRTDDLKTDSCYRLVRRDSTKSDLPDTMTVWLDEGCHRIERLEFFDINHDHNALILLRQELMPDCREQLFVPDFPGSVEKVRLF